MSRVMAREVLMKLLYEGDINKSPSEESFNYLKEEYNLDSNDISYVNDILNDFPKNKSHIDEYISKYANDWKLERISKIDLAIMRLAISEILYRKDIPISVSINEAVELAKKYGSIKSGSFINGIIGNFVRSENINKIPDNFV